MIEQMPPAELAPPRGWWKVEAAAEKSVNALQDQFRAIFESAGSPPGAALFCNHVVLESTALLFTPRAAAIAQQFIEFARRRTVRRSRRGDLPRRERQ